LERGGGAVPAGFHVSKLRLVSAVLEAYACRVPAGQTH
jgi:hypothetical protein